MEQLAALLEGHLKGHGAARAQCEAQLTTLLRTPGFALQLCEFLFAVGAVQIESAHRQLACILLKKLVTSHWTQGAIGDDEHELGHVEDHQQVVYLVPDQEKQQVRHAIVASIQNEAVLQAYANSKLETALCMAITAIFERDWPDQWPELLPVVVGLVAGQSSSRAMAFAIRFLSLAGNHFSSEHCCELVSVVFPHLQRVFVARGDFTTGVRTRVVRIVENSLQMVGMEAQVGNATAQQLLHGNVSSWIALFLQELAQPVQSVKDNAIQIQILTTLSKFVEEWPKNMSDLLPQIVPHVFGLLTSGVESFDREIVQNADDDDADAYDSDGEGTHIGRSAVVVAAIEFLKSTMHAPTKKTRQLIVGGLGEFVYVMIAYMQITSSQMETWEDDPNKYVADEDDQSLAYNIRNAGTDLIVELEAVLGRKAVVATLQAAQRHLKSEDAGAANWRRQEAALLVVGTVAPSILTVLEKDASVFDINGFLQTLFHVMNATNETIYLRARALWCASKLATGMTTEMLNAFLQVAISGLEQGQVLPVKLYSCRAVGAILHNDAGKQYLQEASAVVVDRLIHLAELASTETLHIALETLVVVLQELPNLSPAAAQSTVACFLQHWSNHLNDPLLSELIDGAFGALLEYDNVEIVANLQAQVLPVLRNMLLQAVAELGAAGNGATIAGSAITVLKTIIKHSFASATGASDGNIVVDPSVRAMSVQIVQLVFEPLVRVLEVVDDEKVLNSGAECLKWLVMFAVDVLAEYKVSTNGSSGIDATMQVAAKLLSPSIDESCAVCVGGLITQILLKLGSALPTETIQSILTAICARLATAKLPSLVQSLCLVFARLVHTHGPEILNVLEQLPAPADASHFKNMLEFVFATWIEKQDEFYGLYCIKVTVSGLLKVAEWNDPRVTQLIVSGSEIVAEGNSADNAAGIQTRTRSKTSGTPSRNKQLTRVHFMTKLITVLAKVHAQLGDDEEEWESSEDDDDESGDEDDDAVASGNGGSIFAPAEEYDLLSDRLDGNGGGAGFADDDAVEDVEEEFEAHFDPLNEVDLKALIPMAVNSVTSNADLLNAIMPELTAADKEALGDITHGSN